MGVMSVMRGEGEGRALGENGGFGAALVSRLGVAALVGLVCFKMLVTYDSLPGWSSDPMVMEVSLGVAVSPAGLLCVNVAIMLAAMWCCVLGCVRMRGGGWGDVVRATLVAIGMGWIAWHVGATSDGSVEDWINGSDMAAAISAGMGCSLLARVEGLARIAAAILIGVVMMLAAKGLLQYFVEHGQLVESFKSQREQILAANGWTADSSAALAFERRLMQQEASGWFGLSNVYGGVMGAGAVALAGLASLSPRGRWRLALWAGVLAAIGGLVMSESKGAVVASVIGMGVLGVGMVARWRAARAHELGVISGALRWLARPSVCGWLAVGMVTATQLGILARGLIGDQLGERSLWFRWFYVQGAARIVSEHWKGGVGPAGFKDAYMIAKPAISPEDVASPHSIPWDLAACYGVGGLAVLAVWVGWVWLAGRGIGTAVGIVSSDGRAELPVVPMDRVVVRVIAMTVALASIASVWVEQGATTIEGAAMKIAGLVAWAVVSVGIAAAMRGRAGIMLGLGAAGIAVAVHAQIEMTSVWTGSGSWVMSVLGLAAGWGSVRERRESMGDWIRGRGRKAWIATGVAAAGVLASASAVVTRVPAVSAWESLMTHAASQPLEVTRLRMKIMEIEATTRPGAERHAAISGAISESDVVKGHVGSVDEAMAGAALDAGRDAMGLLEEAARAVPSHGPTHRTVSQVALRVVQMLPAGLERDAAAVVANREAGAAAELQRQRASGLAWLATVQLELVRLSVVEREAGLKAAAGALERASGLDPYNFQHAVGLARVWKQLGDDEQARRWAAAALELEWGARLDPLKKMDDRTRLEMDGLEGPGDWREEKRTQRR